MDPRRLHLIRLRRDLDKIFLCASCGQPTATLDSSKHCGGCAVRFPAENIGFEEAWLDLLDTALTRLARDQGWGEDRLRRALDQWFSQGPESLGAMAGKESPYSLELSAALERVRRIDFPSRPPQGGPNPPHPR